ncbi:hypothetical protein [Rhizobium mongolense]
MRGVENLFVANDSLNPDALGVNPHMTIMALAFRAAEAALSRSAQERARSLQETETEASVVGTRPR